MFQSCLYMKTKTRHKVFCHLPIWNKSAALYNKTLLVFKVFVCGGGVLNKAHTTPHNKSARHQEHGKGSYNCLMLIIAAHRKLAYITPYYIRCA